MKYCILLLSVLLTLSTCSTIEERNNENREKIPEEYNDVIDYGEAIDEYETEKDKVATDTIATKVPVDEVLNNEDSVTADELLDTIEETKNIDEEVGEEQTTKTATQPVKAFFLIVASFPKKGDAQNMVNQLKKDGYKSAEIVFKKNVGYRVSAGRYETRKAGNADLNRLPKKYKKNSPWVVQMKTP